jgi:hypothetical protein
LLFILLGPAGPDVAAWGSLQGLTVQGAERPIANVDIRLIQYVQVGNAVVEMTRYRTRSDALGRFEIFAVEPGRYFYWANAPHFGLMLGEVSIAPLQNTRITIRFPVHK